MKLTLFSLVLLLLLTFTGCASVGRAVENLDRQIDIAGEAVESALQTELPVAAVPPATAGEITAEEAKAIALTHADLTAEEVRYLRVEYEIDDGLPQYEVNFHRDRWEYDYEIDARTGNILSFQRDD